MKFNDIFFKENFEKNLLSKRDKDDNFDQKKDALSIF
jgi:hypothetical protein